MGTDDILLGDNHAMDQQPVQGGVPILLGASCYGNRHKLRLFGPLARLRIYLTLYSLNDLLTQS